jgi:hypothetical protein
MGVFVVAAIGGHRFAVQFLSVCSSCGGDQPHPFLDYSFLPKHLSTLLFRNVLAASRGA